MRTKLLKRTITLVMSLCLLIGVLGTPIKAEAAGASPYYMRACWLSYLDMNIFTDQSESEFNARFSNVCDRCISNNINTLIIQVRPFGDAMYQSAYFPWSKYINSAGNNPGYDPLGNMIAIAHSKGLMVEAWVNPFRVSGTSDETSKLKSGKGLASKQQFYNTYKGYMMEYTYSGQNCIAFDPANAAARQLIINGVAEIVRNYNVDGIHFDDYFYIGSMQNGVTVEQRKANINELLRYIYSSIKSIDSNCTFGISPAGNISNVRNDGGDVDTWLSSDGYVDYIMPQLYWTDNYNTSSGNTTMFSNRAKQWQALNKNGTAMYVGMGLYRVGEVNSYDLGWSQSSTNLVEQWQKAHSYGYSGYALFRYTDLCDSTKSTEINNLNSSVSANELSKSNALVSYQAFMQDFGLQQGVSDGGVSGITGRSLRLEGYKVILGDKAPSGNINYRSYVQDFGWQNYVSNGSYSGTKSQSKRVEAIQLTLDGEVANSYDIYYRAYCEDYGWLDWACNGSTAGTIGLSKRLEAMQVVLVAKGSPAPGSTANPNVISKIMYTTHVQDYGDLTPVIDGQFSGTEGQSKRMEAINIALTNKEYDGSLQYRTHVQDYGWQDWVGEGNFSGTKGSGKRLEAIEIKLTGKMAEMYDIYYQVHAQDYGWLGWAKNGETAGTEGFGKRLEGIKIVLVPKGLIAPGSTANACYTNLVAYKTHVQDYGWQDYVTQGVMSGTSGQSKRLEGIYITLANQPLAGSIEYRTHVQDYGWQSWVGNNQFSGTSGQSKRLEAIEIRLTGAMADKYDIYYRVHVQDYGWQDWVKNGATAGTSGQSKRLEGIEIKLVEK